MILHPPRQTCATAARRYIEIGYGVATGDVNGHGRLDIIAAGRATGNVVVYWSAHD